MAVRTKDEIMASIRARIGDDSSDEALALVEDLSDTYDDMQAKANGDGTDWKAKYEENDKNWREKYRDRFYGVGAENDPPKSKTKEDDSDRPLTYENLFKED